MVQVNQVLPEVQARRQVQMVLEVQGFQQVLKVRVDLVGHQIQVLPVHLEALEVQRFQMGLKLVSNVFNVRFRF